MNAPDNSPPNPPGRDSLSLGLADEAATALVAEVLGQALRPGCVIHLSGTLGAGKTAFCRALIRSLGYNGRVKSPTYTLVEPYRLSKYELYHFDFYRFSSDQELREAGFEESLDSDAVALIEWPEMAADKLPKPDVLLRLALADDDQARDLHVQVHSEAGRACLNALLANQTICRWQIETPTL
ncbi:MAG: tRNA (adenosine(37)-N6)-threonylcarbamoyltransferase complex ATPase subunit type 1 TsaE [Burkholderiaceae bacterium]